MDGELFGFGDRERGFGEQLDACFFGEEREGGSEERERADPIAFCFI